MSFAKVYQYLCVLFPFGFEDWMWYMIVLVLKHTCLFTSRPNFPKKSIEKLSIDA